MKKERMTVLKSTRLTPELAAILDQLSASEYLKPSQFLRMLLYREAERQGLLPKNASKELMPDTLIRDHSSPKAT